MRQSADYDAGRIEIRYSIHQGGEEVGFGVGSGMTLEQAVYEVESDVCNGQYETTPDMPPLRVLSPGEHP